MPWPVTEGDQEPGGSQGAVADGRRVQNGPRARAGSMAPRLSTETLRWPRRTIPSLQIVSRILTAEATIRPAMMRNCSTSSGSASRSGEPAYAMTTRRPSRLLRDPQEGARASHKLYPTREKAMRDIARYIELRYNRKRLHSATGTGLRKRSAMSSWIRRQRLKRIPFPQSGNGGAFHTAARNCSPAGSSPPGLASSGPPLQVVPARPHRRRDRRLLRPPPLPARPATPPPRADHRRAGRREPPPQATVNITNVRPPCNDHHSQEQRRTPEPCRRQEHCLNTNERRIVKPTRS